MRRVSGKKNKERRVYPKEFKAGAAAPAAEKCKKPAGRLKRPAETEIRPRGQLEPQARGPLKHTEPQVSYIKGTSDSRGLRTTDGREYMTVVLSLYDRKVIGRTSGTSMETVNTAFPFRT
jgi:hypothetical protein